MQTAHEALVGSITLASLTPTDHTSSGTGVTDIRHRAQSQLKLEQRKFRELIARLVANRLEAVRLQQTTIDGMNGVLADAIAVRAAEGAVKVRQQITKKLRKE